MTNPLTIQLPPNLEQQMLHEAQKQNITLETLVLKSLQKDYGTQHNSDPNPTTSIVNFFSALSNGMKTGQPTVQIPVDEINLQMAESFKHNGTILNFQVSAQKLILHLKPPVPKSAAIPPVSEIDLAELDPDIAKIIKDFKDEDEHVRCQAIQNIAKWHEQHS
jgi:ribosomal protein S8